MDRESRDQERVRSRTSDARGRVPALGEENRTKLSDIALIAMVAIAAIVSFSDITLDMRSLGNFTAMTAFLYCITTMTYRNRYNHGKMRGREDPEYKRALSDYEAALKEIPKECTDDMIAEYCEQYKERELKGYRKDLLLSFHVEYDVYKSTYLNMKFWEVLTLKKSWAFRWMILRCNRAKAIRLTPSMILNESGRARRDRVIGMSGAQRERIDKTWEAIWRVIMSVGGGAIVVSLMFDFSWQTVAQWGIRISPVVTAILSGGDAGYNDIAVTETNHKRGQTEMIRRMIEDLNKNLKERRSLDPNVKKEAVPVGDENTGCEN